MKRFVCLMMCVSLFFTLYGCSSNDKVKEDIPKNEEIDTPKNEESKPKTIQGRIIDATSTRFSILTDSGVTYDFDRSHMDFIGDALINDEIIKVTYVEKDGVRTAQKGEIMRTQTPMDTTQSIDEIMEHMSLEEKVGQLFFVRCPADHDVSDVSSYHLGGYILFDRDFRDHSYQLYMDQVKSYQENAKIPLLIGVDEEGGTVNRLSNYTTFRASPFWSPQDLYNYGGYDFIRADTKDKATLLKSLGINVNLAPIADVSTNSSDFIYQRAFGKDANQTAEYVKTVVSEMKTNGIGSTLKHFPGYGNNVDTHTGISIDNRSYEHFVNNDFIPFEAGIDAGVDSILISHNIMSCVDDQEPASLSKKVHDILRNELKFDGVIMSDDLAMDAIQKYTDASVSAIAAIKAGNDLLICSDYREQLPTVIQAYQSGELDLKQLDASIKRILTWKANLKLIDVK